MMTLSMSYGYMFKFMKMWCAVKHKVNIKCYRERDSLLLRYFYITVMLKLFPMTTGNISEMVHISNFTATD